MKEPKALRELHDIREKMSKFSDEELLKDSDAIREKYKDIIASCELKAKKLEIEI